MMPWEAGDPDALVPHRRHHPLRLRFRGRRIAEHIETTGALIREYVWNDWDPVAVIEGGVISFVRADHIGRPVFATNATGVKVWTATYNPSAECMCPPAPSPPTASPASGSRANPASTRTGCATTIRPAPFLVDKNMWP